MYKRCVGVERLSMLSLIYSGGGGGSSYKIKPVRWG